MEIPNSRVFNKELLQAYDESPGYSWCGPGYAKDHDSDKNTLMADSHDKRKNLVQIMFTMRVAAHTPDTRWKNWVYKEVEWLVSPLVAIIYH